MTNWKKIFEYFCALFFILCCIKATLINHHKDLATSCMFQPNPELDSMQKKYEALVLEFQTKTSQLEKDKEKLAVTLADAQVNNNALK